MGWGWGMIGLGQSGWVGYGGCDWGGAVCNKG